MKYSRCFGLWSVGKLNWRFIGKHRRYFITSFNTEAEWMGVQQVLTFISKGCLIHYQWVCLQTMDACNNICDGSWGKGVYTFSGWPNALSLIFFVIFPPPSLFFFVLLSFFFFFLSFLEWMPESWLTLFWLCCALSVQTCIGPANTSLFCLNMQRSSTLDWTTFTAKWPDL